jgi:protocatechuate 3,4-dioxygenase beta subunit
MKFYLATLLLLSGFYACSQHPSNKQQVSDKKVGGSCEGCEAIFESPQAFENLGSTDTLPDFNEPGPKLEISGTIFKSDGKTPAPNVVLYIYHTDQKGNYAQKGNEQGWGKRHGYIRGWVRSDQNGAYKFYTLRPASYPNSRNPQHIHPTIKEPGLSAYWIDEYLFDDDPFLEKTNPERPPRGGKGLIHLVQKNGRWVGTRDIILGKNVPDYPKN